MRNHNLGRKKNESETKDMRQREYMKASSEIHITYELIGNKLEFNFISKVFEERNNYPNLIVRSKSMQ